MDSVDQVLSERDELHKQMKFHFEEYSKLKSKLEVINNSDKRSKVEAKQRSLFNEFLNRYIRHESEPNKAILYEF